MQKKNFAYQSNTIVHVKKHFPKKAVTEDETDFFHKTDKGCRRITEFEVNLIEWKSKKAIPWNAIDDDNFRKLVSKPTSVPCRQTLTTLQKELSDQMSEKAYSEWAGQVISICLDGGTILHNKWIAVNGFGTGGAGVRFNLIDIIVMKDSCSIDNIIQEIIKIRQKLSETGTIICAASTDNAFNMIGCFNNTIKNRNTKYIKDILGLSCSCHTGQLVLSDLSKSDGTYSKIIDELKKFHSDVNSIDVKDMIKANLPGYPTIQVQRWNTYHDCIIYIIKNYDTLSKLLPNNYIIQNIKTVKQIEEAIGPIHDFTRALESDQADQSDVFIQSRIMIQKWKEKENSNPQSKKLISLFNDRCRDTMDIQISEVAYYFSSSGLKEFSEVYNFKDKSTERVSKLRELQKKIKIICDIWGFDTIQITNGFDEITKHTQLFSFKYPTLAELNPIETLNDTQIEQLHEFIKRIMTLPASEAASERVFAAMRDSYNVQMMSLDEKSIKSSLIIYFNTFKKRIFKN